MTQTMSIADKTSTKNTSLLNTNYSHDEIQQIIDLIKTKANYDFSLYKHSTIVRCIQKRMQILQINTFQAYIYYLYQRSHEITILFKSALIQVTRFFRDEEAFELLKQQLLHRITNHSYTDKNFRVWIPACSTGEEAYSIAIVLQECMTELNCQLNVQIFATDSDPHSIETARKGIFSHSIENHVSAERLKIFFDKHENTYKIKKDIRNMLVFAVQNIIENPPFTKLSLLSCRNVLIYLTQPLQQKIYLTFHRSLEEKGLLFLGAAENINNSLPDLFSPINNKWRLFIKTSYSEITPMKTKNFPMNISTQNTGLTMIKKVVSQREHKFDDIINNLVSINYTPAFIFVDEYGHIIYLHGKTNKFLEFACGEISLDVASMIKPELKSAICNALRTAVNQQIEIKLNMLPFTTENNQPQYLNVVIKPLNNIRVADAALLLIIIEELNLVIPLDVNTDNYCNVQQPNIYCIDKIINKNITAMYYKDAHKQLQTKIDDLEESHEDLTSINEEAQATNEELQSLNEALLSANLMLENRLEHLLTSHNDIKNLLDHTNIATICVDQDLCIKHYTPPATQLINLIDTDIGRPIYHLLSNLHYKELTQDIRVVINTMEPINSERIDHNGDCYLIKIIPYRCHNNMISGAVLTFLNKSKLQ